MPKQMSLFLNESRVSKPKSYFELLKLSGGSKSLRDMQRLKKKDMKLIFGSLQFINNDVQSHVH